MKREGGFGIGLNIVLSICEKYNIELNVKLKLKEGSEFSLKFPKVK